jgi:hypothetical protein
MVSHHFFSQLVLLTLLWLFVILHFSRPKRPVTAPAVPALPESLKPKRPRSNEPQPFEGLTHKPHCALCAQDTASPKAPPPVPPAPMAPTHRRPRAVDTSRHFCPHRDCDYRGWRGLRNLRANGLPTICQPRFVNFLSHLHDWLTTNAAGIIAGAMTQHGHKNTQQSVTNMA